MSDIQMLFQKDPLGMTREEIKEICEYYRSKFQAFQLGDKTAGATKKAKEVKKLTSEELNALLNDL